MTLAATRRRTRVPLPCGVPRPGWHIGLAAAHVARGLYWIHTQGWSPSWYH